MMSFHILYKSLDDRDPEGIFDIKWTSRKNTKCIPMSTQLEDNVKEKNIPQYNPLNKGI